MEPAFNTFSTFQFLLINVKREGIQSINKQKHTEKRRWKRQFYDRNGCGLQKSVNVSRSWKFTEFTTKAKKNSEIRLSVNFLFLMGNDSNTFVICVLEFKVEHLFVEV